MKDSSQKQVSRNRIFFFTGLLAVVLAVTLLFLLAADTADLLHQMRQSLKRIENLATDRPYFSALSFVALYTILAACCVPGMFLLTMMGGALFGFWKGLALTSIGATLGSYVFFSLICRFFRSTIEEGFAVKIAEINTHLQKDGIFYLIGMRLFFVLPYYLINLLLACTRVPHGTFLASTVVGMLPIHVAYTYAGTGMHAIGSDVQIVDGKVLMPLLALAVVSVLLPTLRYVRRP